jgi:hypothetical protein
VTRERGAEGIEPLHGRAQVARPADESDLAMPERDEVRDGLFDPFLIIHDDVVHALPRASQIEEDDADAPPRQFADERGVEFRSHQRDARHLALDETLHVARRAPGLVVRVRQNHVVAALESRALD